MRTQRSGFRAGSRRAIGLAALLVTIGLAAGVVAGCSSGGSPGADNAGNNSDGSGQAAEETGQASPVQLELAPADQAVDVSVIDPVTVTATDGQLTEVVMTNAAGRQVAGEANADNTAWTSGEPLGYGKTYTVTVTAVGAGGEPVTSTSSFTTVQPRTVTFPSMNPLEGQVVGVGQPIAVYFDEPIADKAAAEAAIGITTTPAVDGAFYWFSDSEVHWRPERYWPAGTKVVADLKVYGKDLGNGIYGQEDRRISFRIGDEVIARADGKSHQMSVTINGKPGKKMPVSLGKPAAPSNNGVHVVTEHHATKIMDSSSYGVPVNSPEGYRTKVKWAVRISNGGEFVHSAPWSVADQGRRNVSHGCVNASPANAKWFFDTVKKGDIVIITNAGGPDLQPWDGFGDWNIPWSQWKAGGHR